MTGRLIGNIRYFLDKCKEDNINAFAAQSAFFILLSAIPFLMVFSSLLKYTPVTEDIVMSIINQTMPGYVAPFCVSIIQEVYSKSVGILSVAAVAAIWSAAKGMQYVTNGLNMIHNIPETRNWFVKRFWAIIYTIVLVFAVVISMVLLVFGTSLQEFIVTYIPFMIHITDTIIGMRSLILLGILILFFSMLFKTLPNQRVSLRSQLPGAVICAFTWCLFSFGLSVYVEEFDGFSMYGSLTTIVLIMLWLYFCMYIMMVCAEINVIYGDTFRRWVKH